MAGIAVEISTRATQLDANQLAAALGIRRITAELLVARGIVDAATAKRFLAPRLADLRAPEGTHVMRSFGRLVDRIVHAIDQHETIAIFGDYDVDGVTSCALLTGYLRQLGGQVVPRVARREDGYGLQPAVVESIAHEAPSARVLIVCDCGTNDREGLLRAKALGLDVLIIDHHQAPAAEPEAFALCNPHHRECAFPFKGLASVGVAFYVVAALRSRRAARGLPAPDVRPYLDLVALGTIADLAPLVDENRMLVAAGLKQMRTAERPGIAALCAIAELDAKKLRAIDIGLRLAPRLNAPGRLGAAEPALQLLLADTLPEAQRLAAVCDEKNQQRRDIQTQMADEAFADAALQQNSVCIVVARDSWHPGVAGIVAGKLVERFRRPAFVLAIEGQSARGSGRSIDGISIYAALMTCMPLVERAGGHAMAAGASLAAANIPAWREALCVAVAAQARTTSKTTADLTIALGDVDEKLADELERLGPFGMANPEPRFAARGLAIDRARVVGKTHLQVTLRALGSGGGEVRQAIGFGMAERAPPIGAVVDAIFSAEIDEWGGTRRVRLRLHDLTLAETSGLPAATIEVIQVEA